MKLDTQILSAWVLQIRCVVQRYHLLTVCALGISVAGVLCAVLWVPYLRDGLTAQMATVEALKLKSKSVREVPAAPMSQNELHIQAFYENLGEKDYAEQQLKTLFGIAAKNNLQLNAGEYKSSLEKNSAAIAYQIQLPVTGPYSAIREFCEEVLLTIPFASLDEISFKREAISKNDLDANLRFTLYLAASNRVGQQ